jgi:predicted TPR repeat methyltransferase
MSTEVQLKDLISKHRAGDHAAAEKGYRECLRDQPENATALHFLGLLRTQQGHSPDGIELIKAAVRIDPDYVDAWSNLSIAFLRERNFDQAEMCCRKAIQLSPNCASAWGNLGMALRAKNAYEETLQAWSRALELQPCNRNVAVPYGQLLYKMNRIEQARDFYRKWCEANPDDSIARHMLAALGGSAQPERASDGYVRLTFDDFADSFDERLQQLQYRAPELLHQAATRSLEAASHELNILDLGCGTGLCGMLFQSIARRLVGVDLSSKMLAKAAARGCYQQLNFGELTAYLSACRERFDLVLAADVLCYFGELCKVFERVRSVLAADGRFVFSLEAGADDAPGFTIKPHGRYEHHRAYVHQALGSASLRVTSWFEQPLRLESGRAVTGFIVVAIATA